MNPSSSKEDTAKFALLTALAALSLVGVTTSMAAGGNSPAQLSAHGWSCFVPPGNLVHCSPPGARRAGSGAPTLSLQMFDTTDANSTTAEFLGTEHLIRADLYRGQPCPQDPGPDGGYTLLPFGYYACHHFDA